MRDTDARKKPNNDHFGLVATSRKDTEICLIDWIDFYAVSAITAERVACLYFL